ncbi:hypothetical protein F5884DRAFT_778967 [Xylogone sp. PMI_703]|nr:hypothetical protein F5884DRAFT_778967 [Xylogone sp. PMI_703]
MAPLDQILYTQPVIRPVHVTLTEPHPSFRTLVNTLEDPYYKHNYSQVKRHDVISPPFDVRETDGFFFLEGEFPGVADKEELLIQQLGNRTLLVETKVERFSLEKEWGEFAPKAKRDVEKVEADDNGMETTYARRHRTIGHEGDFREEGIIVRLAERHPGYMQRSFTFPCAVELGALRARMRNGLLVMMVPKSDESKEPPSRRIAIED